MNRRTLFRDAMGFAVGGLMAAIASGLVYIAFLGTPKGAHNGEDGAPLAVLVLFMFFAGGCVGLKGFTADFRSDLYPSIIGSYVVAIFLCLTGSLSFLELAVMIGFVTVGLLVSSATSVLLMSRFPPEIIDEWKS